MYEYFQQRSTNVHNYTLWCSRLSYNILYFYIWNPYTASSVFVNISFVHTQTKAWTIPTFNIFRGVRLEFSLCKHPKLIQWQTVQKFTFEMVQKFCHIIILCYATQTTDILYTKHVNSTCISDCVHVYLPFAAQSHVLRNCIFRTSSTLVWYLDPTTHL